MNVAAIHKRAHVYRKIAKDLRSDIARQIYDSDTFRKAMKQAHHGHTSVAVHTICVAVISLRIYYYLYEHHIRLNKNFLIKGALLHDLGIVGRYSKYANDVVCCYRHPIDSVSVAESIFHHVDETIIDSILHHMFPMTPIPPHHLEGYVLIAADKYCASVETAYGKDRSPAAVFLNFIKEEYAQRIHESHIHEKTPPELLQTVIPDRRANAEHLWL